MREQDILLAQLDRYWKCLCGGVIDDPNVTKTLGPENGWGVLIPCPKCGRRISKSKFPSTRFRPLFEMIVECSQIERAILVLILAQTAFEAMLGDFLVELLLCMNCPDDVELGIANALSSFDARARFIECLTGKSITKMIRDVGFKNIMTQFKEIRTKRNSFLHTAVKKEELTMDDIKGALKFAYTTVDLYAALYSKYGEPRPLVEPDEDHPF